jgi:hypothetical protein
MSHLTADEMIDAVDGILESMRHAHLAACSTCRSEVERLAETLSTARSVAIPEPSPLFWDYFSRRVRAALAEETSVRPWPIWLRWPVLVPLTALGLLIVALTTVVPQTSPPPGQIVTTVAGAHDQAGPAETDADGAVDSAWAFIVESIGPLDVETAQEAGIAASPGEAERAALHLTDAEQAELVKLLQQELTRAGS